MLKLFCLSVFGLITLVSGCTCDPSGTVDPYAYVLKTNGKIFAIGDLHGDLEQTKKALALTGAIDATGHWIGKNLIVVQTGDQIDRWNDDRSILDYLDGLANEAIKHGSHLVVLNGNHETMNVDADMRYVTPESFATFSDYPLNPNIDPNRTLISKTLPKSVNTENRVSAFHPGSFYASLLSKRSFYAVVNDSLFVHGGIVHTHVEYGLENINEEMKNWMQGKSEKMPRFMTGVGPLWNRDFSEGKVSEANCILLQKTLLATKTKRMIVGHTIQETINSDCDNRVWRIDIGMSEGYSPVEGIKPHVQVLQIDGENVSVLQ